MLKYFRIPPGEALQYYVRSFWVLEYKGMGCPYVHRQMADGCAEFLFNYQGNFHKLIGEERTEQMFYAGVQAPANHSSRFLVSDNFGLFGAYLFPYAIPLLFNIPADDISNQTPDIAALLGGEGKELEDKMIMANNNELRVQILSSFLINKIGNAKHAYINLYSSIATIMKHKGNINIEELPNEFNLSVRQFQRKFKEYSGFSPKGFARISRFRSVLEALPSNTSSLTDLALKHGYFDQSHFTNEFKELSGFTPKEFLKNTADRTLYAI